MRKLIVTVSDSDMLDLEAIARAEDRAQEEVARDYLSILLCAKAKGNLLPPPAKRSLLKVARTMSKIAKADVRRSAIFSACGRIVMTPQKMAWHIKKLSAQTGMLSHCEQAQVIKRSHPRCR